MKKVFAIFAVAAMCFAVVACGQKKAEEEVAPIDSTAVEAVAADSTKCCCQDSTCCGACDSTKCESCDKCCGKCEK